MEQKLPDTKASESWRIFRAFLSSLPPSEGASLPDLNCWRYLTGNGEPDFLWPEGRMAVELTGWIDQTQIYEGKTLEHFNKKVRAVLLEQRAKFERLEGHWVYLEALQKPDRKWTSLICPMLVFFADRANAVRNLRLHLESSELPQEIREMFAGATIYKMPGQRASVRAVEGWRSRASDQSVDADEAIERDLKRSFESLRQNLRKKLDKAEKYRAVVEARNFAKLWLVIHYDDTALEWAAPLLVPVVQFGYGPDAHESQRELARRARDEVWSDLEGGHFDRVYLLFPDQPAPFSEKLWP